MKYYEKLRKPKILYFIKNTTPTLNEVKDAERLTDCVVTFKTIKLGVTVHDIDYDDMGNPLHDGVAGTIPDLFKDYPKANDLIKKRKADFDTAMVEHEREQDRIRRERSRKAKEEALVAKAKEDAKAELAKKITETDA